LPEGQAAAEGPAQAGAWSPDLWIPSIGAVELDPGGEEGSFGGGPRDASQREAPRPRVPGGERVPSASGRAGDLRREGCNRYTRRIANVDGSLERHRAKVSRGGSTHRG